MLECFSEPIGGYSIMALDEREELYNHILRVLFDAAIDSPVDLLLHNDNCTSVERLRQLIKRPGLRRLSLRFGLTDEQYEDLLGLESYINWTNNAGHFDISTQTLDNFDAFIGITFNVNNPITYDKRRAQGCRITRMSSSLWGQCGENGEMYMADSSQRMPDANIPHLIHTAAILTP